MFILLSLTKMEGKPFHTMVPVDSIAYVNADDEGEYIGLISNGVLQEYILDTDWHVVQDRLAACGRFIKA